MLTKLVGGGKVRIPESRMCSSCQGVIGWATRQGNQPEMDVSCLRWRLGNLVGCRQTYLLLWSHPGGKGSSHLPTTNPPLTDITTWVIPHFFWPKMAWQANIECDILNEMEIMWQGCARFRQSGCPDMCRRISARGLHFGCSCSSQSETGSTPTATTASTLHL